MNLSPIKYSRRNFARLLGGASIGFSTMARTFAEVTEPKAFDPFFGVCTSYKNFNFLAEAGYKYVEENAMKLLKPEESDAKVAQVINEIIDKKIPVYALNGFLPSELKATGATTHHEAILTYSDVAFRRAKQIGARGIVFGSARSRKLANGFDRAKAESQFVSLLEKMAPIADSHGVEVWLEPLNRKEDNFLNTQIQGAAILDQIGHPSLGMVSDLYHMALNEESPEDFAECIHHVRHCHLAEKEGRTPPGVNNHDFKPYLSVMKSAGFNGNMSMECHWGKMKEQAERARKYIINQIKEV